MILRLSILTVIVSVTACTVDRAGPPRIELPGLYLQAEKYSSKSITKIIKPGIPNALDGGRYRYGYFCARNHPNIRVGMEDSELVLRYFTIYPWDDIDAECRDHDLCWIAKGENDGTCNKQFLKRIEFLFHDFWSAGNPGCTHVTSDIKAAFSSIFIDNEYKEKRNTKLDKFGKIFLIPFQAVVAVPFAATLTIEYPKVTEGERCLSGLPQGWRMFGRPKWQRIFFDFCIYTLQISPPTGLLFHPTIPHRPSRRYTTVHRVVKQEDVRSITLGLSPACGLNA